MSTTDFFSSTKGKVITIALLLIILLSGVIYYFMYGSEEAKYSRNANKIISSIEEANNEATSIYKEMDSGVASSDKIKSSLNKSSDILQKALSLAKNTTPPDNYKSIHNNLINGINSNRTLFMQSKAIIDNYSSDTVSSSINNLYEYLSSTAGYYEKFKFKNTKLELSKDFLTFPDKVNYYVGVLKKSETSNLPNNDAKIEFLNDLRINIDKLNSIETSLNNEITSVKSNKKSSTQLMIFISSLKNQVSPITESINKLNTPNDLEEIKLLSTDVVEEYLNYLSSFRSAIETSSGKSDIEVLNSSIDKASSSLKEYKSKLSSLLSTINEKENALN